MRSARRWTARSPGRVGALDDPAKAKEVDEHGYVGLANLVVLEPGSPAPEQPDDLLRAIRFPQTGCGRSRAARRPRRSSPQATRSHVGRALEEPFGCGVRCAVTTGTDDTASRCPSTCDATGAPFRDERTCSNLRLSCSVSTETSGIGSSHAPRARACTLRSEASHSRSVIEPDRRRVRKAGSPTIRGRTSRRLAHEPRVSTPGRCRSGTGIRSTGSRPRRRWPTGCPRLPADSPP